MDCEDGRKVTSSILKDDESEAIKHDYLLHVGIAENKASNHSDSESQKTLEFPILYATHFSSFSSGFFSSLLLFFLSY